MTPNVKDIVDYEVPDTSPAVAALALAAKEIVPLLVVQVADDKTSYSGFAFLPTGTTEYVTVSTVEPPPAPKFDPQTGAALPGTVPATPTPVDVENENLEIDTPHELTPDQQARIAAILGEIPTPPPGVASPFPVAKP